MSHMHAEDTELIELLEPS